MSINKHSEYETQILFKRITVNKRNSTLRVFEYFIHVYCVDRDLNQEYITSCSSQQIIQYPPNNYMFRKIWIKCPGYVERKKVCYFNVRISTHKKCDKDFSFLQFADSRPWYILLHSPNDMENNLACGSLTYYPPVGTMSLIKVQAFDIRWVHNIHHLFTANLRR
jgi:hypothetical protein